MDGVWQIFVELAAAMAMCPFAFFWECFPCCQGGCGVADSKPRTDPANEGTWTPSGTWDSVGGVTWTFNANPGDDSGETWFFFGSASTSKVGGGATLAERQDWGNPWQNDKIGETSAIGTATKPQARQQQACRKLYIYLLWTNELLGCRHQTQLYIFTLT